MPRAFVLLTALPPTLGHLRLIQFSAALADTTVLFCTEPGEPYKEERFYALSRAVYQLATVRWITLYNEQNPEAPGFWDDWRKILRANGFRDGDYIVSSELYGKRLAEEAGGVFVPYDLNRTITNCKATWVRANPVTGWKNILPEFREIIQPLRVTVFGAESCGKTTLAEALSDEFGAPWLFEWARPYLEVVGPEVTPEKMEVIWKGQRALQKSSGRLLDSPVIFQDTDLFSTVGYWKMYDPESMPKDLVDDAFRLKSDLYLICPSNIPFEADQLRYGGNERETPDRYWIDLCEKAGLNYRVLTKDTPWDRVYECYTPVNRALDERFDSLYYHRKYND